MSGEVQCAACLEYKDSQNGIYLRSRDIELKDVDETTHAFTVITPIDFSRKVFERTLKNIDLSKMLAIYILEKNNSTTAFRDADCELTHAQLLDTIDANIGDK